MAARHDLVEALNSQARAEGWPIFCDPTQAFERPDLLEFVAIWREHLAGRAAPSRSEMTARILKRHLDKIVLFERVDAPQGRRYRVRLMGTGLVPIWGDLTNTFIDEAVPPRLQGRWHAFIDLVLATGEPQRFAARVDYDDQNYLVAEIAAVPLADDAGNVAMVMAAIHVSSETPWDTIVGEFIARSRQERG